MSPRCPRLYLHLCLWENPAKTPTFQGEHENKEDPGQAGLSVLGGRFPAGKGENRPLLFEGEGGTERTWRQPELSGVREQPTTWPPETGQGRVREEGTTVARTRRGTCEVLFT